MDYLGIPKTIIMILIVLCLTSTDGVCKSVARKCPRITKQEVAFLEKQLLDSGSGLHWSFYLVPQLQRSKQESLKPIDSSNINAKYIFLYGKSGKACPRQTKASPVINLHDSCPVHYLLQHDLDRVPQNLVHAKCNCRKCQNGASLGLSCRPVYTYTKVFRRSNGCNFEIVLEPIPVACTCTSSHRLIIVDSDETKTVEHKKVRLHKPVMPR